jgi:hypothetical protein
MQLVIDFYFLSICIKLYMFRASSAHHQESLTVHTDSSFCVYVCLRHCLVRKSVLYVQWGTPDDDSLTLETCGVVYIWIENKNLSQVASVGLLIGIYEVARTDQEILNMKTFVQNWVVVTSEVCWRFDPSRDVTFLSDQSLETFRSNLLQPIFKVKQSNSNRNVYLWKVK